MSKMKNVCFTLNNPTEAERIWWRAALTNGEDSVTYLVLQEETGENGTVHLQGYVELADRKRLTWLRRHLSARAHWERRRGTQLQAIAYCQKAESRVEGGLAGDWGEPRVIYSYTGILNNVINLGQGDQTRHWAF